MAEPEQPSPPEEVAQYVIDGLNRQDADKLRRIASYSNALANWKEAAGATDQRSGENEDDQAADQDDRPSAVPAKASTVVKKINNNRYYYWQWRDGDKIRSKYKGPVRDE
ncbi:hypothetical protein [Haloarchaeobius sp. TZWSO28]|uniref:hypothetical protein n=1 Tax=Haloarchaeobius sp. TZWSO28 TaxID=3446119 RepID=UPI003EB82530